MNELMETVVAGAETAVKLPESALRIMRLTDDPDAKVSDIQSVIETDSALSARVLRVANSATYSRLRDVADIGTAVNLIGFREISRIAFAVSALGGLSVLQNKLITISDYQRHSLICASLCGSIAQVTGHVGGGTFAAGLLHDIGQLVMFHHCETQMIDAMDMATHREDVTLVQAEDSVLGFNHAEVGAALASSWGLPESIVHAIAFHHRADWPDNFLPSIAIVAYANKIATRPSDPSYVPIRADAPQMQRIGEVIDLTAVDEAAMLEVARGAAADMVLAAA